MYDPERGTPTWVVANPPPHGDSVKSISSREFSPSRPHYSHLHTTQRDKEATGKVNTLQMERDDTYNWLIQSERRKEIIRDFGQPLTATQIARRTGTSLDRVLHLLWTLTLYRVLYCLNRDTRHNRLYWLTELGKTCQRKLREALALQPLNQRFPRIPWDLYSSVCYSHRSAVIQAMRAPMQAAAIKRLARLKNADLRMSANNARDVLWYLLAKGIVRRIVMKQRSHPRYELTEVGKAFQELLVGVMRF